MIGWLGGTTISASILELNLPTMTKSYPAFHSGIEPSPCDVFFSNFPFWNWTFFFLSFVRENDLFEWFWVQSDTPLPNILHPQGLLFHLRILCRSALYFLNGITTLYNNTTPLYDLFLWHTSLYDPQTLDVFKHTFYGEKHLFSTNELSQGYIPMKTVKSWYNTLFPRKTSYFGDRKGLFCEENSISSILEFEVTILRL